MATVVRKTPRYAPGQHVRESLRDGIRMLASPEITSTDTSPVLAFQIPANTLVVGILIDVTTAWTTSSATFTISLGDTDVTNCLGSVSTPYLSSTGMVGNLASGKHYTEDKDLYITYTGTPTAGAAKVYALFRTESNVNSW